MSITLDNIVRSYLLKRGHNTLHGYLKIMYHLIEFVRKFSMNHAFMDKTIGLKMDTKKAIAFPTDCVRPTKIGWKSGDRVVAFEIDNSIALSHDYCDDQVAGTANTKFDPYQGWPYNGDIVFNNYVTASGIQTNLLAYKTGYNGAGYFKINWRQREIQFSSDVKSDWTIYIEYKSNGFEPKTQTVIPEFAQKLAEDYVHWQLARFDKRFGDASVETEARKRAFWAEYDEVNAQMDPTTYSDIVGRKARSSSLNRLAI